MIEHIWWPFQSHTSVPVCIGLPPGFFVAVFVKEETSVLGVAVRRCKTSCVGAVVESKMHSVVVGNSGHYAQVVLRKFMQQWLDLYVRASIHTKQDYKSMLPQETFPLLDMTAIDKTPYLGTDKVGYLLQW